MARYHPLRVLRPQFKDIAREADLIDAIGLISSPSFFPLVQSFNPTSQLVHAIAHFLYKGEKITNVVAHVQTAAAGTAPTGLKLGIWSSAATPVCVAATADLAADARWTSQSFKVNALTATYVVPSDGIYYAVFWMNGAFGTTNLGLTCANGSGQVGNAIGTGKQLGGSVKAAATTMSVSDTGTYGVGVTPWLALN